MPPLRGSINLIVYVPWAVAHGYQNAKPTALFFLKCQSRIKEVKRYKFALNKMITWYQIETN